jgi:hypothetical protein
MTSYSALRAAKDCQGAADAADVRGHRPAMQSRMPVNVAGLGVVIGVIIWKRYAFADCSTRRPITVEGTFPELRVGGGGAYAHRVMAAPFVVAW